VKENIKRIFDMQTGVTEGGTHLLVPKLPFGNMFCESGFVPKEDFGNEKLARAR
jgi:hypothetical protein